MSYQHYSLEKVELLMQKSLNFLHEKKEDQTVECLKEILGLKLNFFELGMHGLKDAFKKKMNALSLFAEIVLRTQLDKHLIDFAVVVSDFRLVDWNKNIEDAILLCLKNPSIDPQMLAATGLSLLQLKPYSLKDPLLLSLMRVILPDINLEGFLKEARKELLLQWDNFDFLKSFQSFIYALSQQCYINEYVYTTTDEEEILIEELISHITFSTHTLDSKQKMAIVLLSCYRSLYDTPLKEWIGGFNNDDTPFSCIIKQQIFDHMGERKLVSSIPTLGSIENSVSRKVRLQYEENPYPRWTYVNRVSSVPFCSLMGELFPEFAPPPHTHTHTHV